MAMVLFVAIAAVAAASLVSGYRAPNITSKLQVHIPKSLSKEGGYDHREALFDLPPPYGTKLIQDLYYADSNLCGHADTRAGFPLRPYDSNGEMMPWPSPFVLMVDRGNCDFVSKVRNAQHAGAAGVIIAYTHCLCDAGDICPYDPEERCYRQEIPDMYDNGATDFDITIPSFLMFKQDADPIKAELRQNRMVRIEMSWPSPPRGTRVDYEFWGTPTDLTSRSFFAPFKDAAMALGEHAYFTPYMYINDGAKMGCIYRQEGNCGSFCTNGGRYCVSGPDNDWNEGISGVDVVRESLRRLCAWRLYGKEDGVGVEWWDYNQEFSRRCHLRDKFTDEDCVRNAMNNAKMDYVRVQNCMRDSGGLEGDVKNSIFEEQLAAQEASRVVMVPTVFVNGVRLRDADAFPAVFKAVCDRFTTGSAPEVCQDCAYRADPQSCVVEGYQSYASTNTTSGGGGTGKSLLLVFFMVVIVAVVGALGLKYVERRHHDEMRAHVRGILAEYMPLEGDSGDVGSPLELSTRSDRVPSAVSEER